MLSNDKFAGQRPGTGACAPARITAVASALASVALPRSDTPPAPSSKFACADTLPPPIDRGDMVERDFRWAKADDTVHFCAATDGRTVARAASNSTRPRRSDKHRRRERLRWPDGRLRRRATAGGAPRIDASSAGTSSVSAESLPVDRCQAAACPTPAARAQSALQGGAAGLAVERGEIERTAGDAHIALERDRKRRRARAAQPAHIGARERYGSSPDGRRIGELQRPGAAKIETFAGKFCVNA